MTVARKIVYNVLFSAVSKVLSTALALVGIGFVMRYLGVSGYGEYALALTYFSFFGALGDLGLYAIVTREISRKHSNEEYIIGNVFTLRLISAVFLLGVSPIFLWLLPYSIEMKKAIFLSGVAFVLSSSYLVLNGVFQKRLEMNRVALVELLGKVIQVGLLYAAIQYQWGFLAIVTSLPGFMLFNFLLVVSMSRRFVKWKFRIDITYWKVFLRESLPMGAAGLVIFLYYKFDTILLSFLQNSNAVGIYSGAYKIVDNIVFFPAMIMGLIFPLFSRHIFEEREIFQQYAHKTFKIFIILTIPLIVGVLFFARELVVLLGGQAFEASAGVLRILVFALAAMFFGQWANSILLAGNLQRKMLRVLIGCAVFNIVANSVFIPQYSYTAAAVISVITEIFVVFFGVTLIRKHLGYVPNLPEASRIVISGVFMVCLLFLLAPQMYFLLAGLLSVIFYFGALIIFGALKTEEFRGVFAK